MRNTIVHGDCLEVLSNIPSNSIDLISTDPPYGIKYISNSQGVDRKIRNKTNKSIVVRGGYFGEINNDSVVPLEWLVEAYRILSQNSAIYIFCRWDKWDILKPAVEKAGFSIKNMIVVNKSNHGMGDLMGQYAPKHELLMFAAKGRHILRFPNGRKSDVWDLPVRFSGAKRLHPNEKPVSWFDNTVLNSSDVGGLVLDPFCGSGSCLKSAKNNDRSYIGVDSDQKWIDVATERLAKMELA